MVPATPEPGPESADKAPDAHRIPAATGTARIDVDWAERYRPRHLRDVIGNNKPVLTMKKWADLWTDGPPEKRALVLEGTPGIGKTSAAHALAADMGWDVIELNASDARSAPIIQRIAGTGSVTNTFGTDGSFRPRDEGGRTLIILDEADNLYERGGKAAASGGEDLSDRGGKRAIIDTIRQTRQPIILIVNDYYGLTKGGGAALRSLAEAVKFQRPQARSIAKRLAEICKDQGVRAHPDALVRIAEEANGDMRAAVNDLQAAAQGQGELRVEDVAGLGMRDTGRSVFDAMPDIFKSHDVDRARKATRDLDENPEHIILWVDENLPNEYKEPDDLARGYDMVSKADVYLGRVRRRQYYGMWRYAGDLMTAGVCMAKKRPYKGWTRWQFPSWLRKMSSSRANRNLRDGLAKKVARHTHTSAREARSETLEPLGTLVRNDEELAVAVGADLALTPDEIAFLLETKPTTKKVKVLHEKIQEELEKRPKEHAAVWGGYAEADEAPEEEQKEAPSKKVPAKPKAENEKKAAPKRKSTPPPEDEDAAVEANDEAEDERPQPGQGQKGLFEF